MMRRKFIKNIFLVLAILALYDYSVFAQVQELPVDTESATYRDARDQSEGYYEQVNTDYIPNALGMQQKAWNNPMEHMGDGQIKPGYSRFNWMPDTILPIRVREGMMTMINLPSWELIEKAHIGSPESFDGEVVSPNSLMIYADPSYIGVDSNMIIFGRSGNRYVFYLRSETYNTDKITQSVVDILVGPKWTPISSGGQLADTNGATSTAVSSSINKATNYSSPFGKNTASVSSNGVPQDWLKTIPMDPESIKFDLDMYLPNPEDVDIAPDNIWRDNIFTYIDLGPKALTMTQRPVVSMLNQNVEVPVGFRTRGPNGRLIVVEGIGDLVLRNGRKIICIKMRRDPAAGLEYTDYSASLAHSPNMEMTPTNPGLASDKLMSVTPAIITEDGAAYQDSVGTTLWSNRNNPYGDISENKYLFDDNIRIKQTNKEKGTEGAGILVPTVGVENIAIELGTSTQIEELESLWSKIYSKNKELLSGYEPYYSVDATADGEMVEVFRLRTGMFKEVSAADSLCRKLGRKGHSCSVIKIK